VGLLAMSANKVFAFEANNDYNYFIDDSRRQRKKDRAVPLPLVVNKLLLSFQILILPLTTDN
jgi:hypothetical protein